MKNHNLDFLHGILSATRWVCTRREFPREWELAVCFRTIPFKGSSYPEALAVAWREEEGKSNAYVKETFAKARAYLHGKILRMSATGTVEGKPFKAIIPVQFKAPGYDWVQDCEVLEPKLDRPGVWTLRDKETLAVVEFTLPVGATDRQKKAIIERAMNRMLAIRSRIALVHTHTRSPRSADRIN